VKLDLGRIPKGWFLADFREMRTPVNYAGDHHRPTGAWYCALQWIEGGGRLLEGRGPNPNSALDNAIERAINWDGERHTNQSRRDK
jgi:hypothetical protein